AADFAPLCAGTSAASAGVPAGSEMLARDWDRVAADYYSEVVSPLRGGVPVPLARALARIPGAQRKTAGDLGCGLGRLLPVLAARLRPVRGVRLSPALLARARTARPAAH